MTVPHAPSMDHDLIPFFIMRSGGIIINDFPNIRCEDPTVDDQSVSFDHSDMRIPLRLNGVFSYFHESVY